MSIILYDTISVDIFSYVDKCNKAVIDKYRHGWFIITSANDASQFIEQLSGELPYLADIILNGDDEYSSLMHDVIQNYKCPSLLQLLISCNLVDVNRKNENNYTPLQAAYIKYMSELGHHMSTLTESWVWKIRMIINKSARIKPTITYLRILIQNINVDVNVRWDDYYKYEHSCVHDIYYYDISEPRYELTNIDDEGYSLLQYSYFCCRSTLGHATTYNDREIIDLLLERPDIIVD